MKRPRFNKKRPRFNFISALRAHGFFSHKKSDRFSEKRKLIYRLATFASDHGIGVHDLAPGDNARAYKGRLYTKWTRQLSLARIKTIADRLSGAALDAQSTRLAARRPITTVAASQR